MSPRRLESMVQDDEEGAISVEKDWMVHSHNVYRKLQNRQTRREQQLTSPECYGMRTLKSDDMGEVMKYAFSPRGNKSMVNSAYGNTRGYTTFNASKERLNRTLQEENTPQ